MTTSIDLDGNPYSTEGNLKGVQGSESDLSALLCCEDCGKQDDTVRHDICPYASEINDSHIPIVICPDCYYERCMDI